MKSLYISSAFLALLFCFPHQSAAVDTLYEARKKIDPSVVYQDKFLTCLDFPIGAVGGSVIRMNGKAERARWQIFNNFAQPNGSGVVPNSFFAIRTKAGDVTQVRALQTSAVGPFAPMTSLTFQGEYPFGWYRFQDQQLPVQVMLEAYNPLIPMDLKNSAIPCAIFRITVSNPSAAPVEVSLLATQQNAVGFSGYDVIDGQDQRHNQGYGSNENKVYAAEGRTGVALTGPAGSLHLSAHANNVSATASWQNLTSLHTDFAKAGTLSGAATASSPAAQTTVDAALASNFVLKPGAEQTITFVLSWHIPGGDFGRGGVAPWFFKKGGSQYENWWANAAEVDAYVAEKFAHLDYTTRLFHQTVYSSNIPRYVLDRMTSNLSVLKSPTCFWTKAGYFGVWESTSDKPEWFGNCKHVMHYAQGHARLYPELGRLLRDIDLRTQTGEGALPSRDGELKNAMDGHFGTILGVYREHLLSDNNTYLTSAWPRTRKAMDFAIETFDKDRDGIMSGSYHNTLDCNVSGTSPWIGSLYLAALKASEKMATIMGEASLAAGYRTLWDTGIKTQDAQLWDDKLGYYIEKTENLPDTKVMAKAVSLDMFLGQWWAQQLDLGRIYPDDRTRAGLLKIYTANRYTDSGTGYKPAFRDFLGTGDTGWRMFVHPGNIPGNTILYYNEVMSGFEYAAATAMIQQGMIQEGLSMVQAIAKRYDGRHRAKGEVHMASNSTVTGTGSPFGEDECGKFYARALSSWSLLLALQGFIYDGPRQSIGFQPVWQPEDHASFFSTAKGWGLFTQSRTDSSQQSTINLTFGTLDLKSIILETPNGKKAADIRITINGKPLPISASKQLDNRVEIQLQPSATLKAGSSIKITFNLTSVGL